MLLARVALAALSFSAMAASAPAMSLIPTMGVASPDGRILVQVAVAEGAGQLFGDPRRQGDPAEIAPRGWCVTTRISRRASPSTTNYLTRAGKLEKVEDRYEMLTAKRRHNLYLANRQCSSCKPPRARAWISCFRFRMTASRSVTFSRKRRQIRRISREASSFIFLPETRAWLQPIVPARRAGTRPIPPMRSITRKTSRSEQPSPHGSGWVFPALFRAGRYLAAVERTGLRRNYCGTRLQATRRSSEYSIAFPGPLENQNGAAIPESTLPWTTPWRLWWSAAMNTVAESILGVDLADRPRRGWRLRRRAPAKRPGVGRCWVTINRRYVQKRFIDFAADMGWRYTLVDALWDKQIGYDGLKELVDYARSKNVKILIWYNSAGDWNTAPQTPRDP